MIFAGFRSPLPDIRWGLEEEKEEGANANTTTTQNNDNNPISNFSRLQFNNARHIAKVNLPDLRLAIHGPGTKLKRHAPFDPVLTWGQPKPFFI